MPSNSVLLHHSCLFTSRHGLFSLFKGESNLFPPISLCTFDNGNVFIFWQLRSVVWKACNICFQFAVKPTPFFMQYFTNIQGIFHMFNKFVGSNVLQNLSNLVTQVIVYELKWQKTLI